ncbi:hypothetical protein MNB_SV-13-1619 [hydrothermal vent metagenome]|uniref:Uncharacterized protein n=1 Tax=hydrothermal vent metagenome TaxID=652676 RepID=A0A1W1C8E6_9ZZZZ
MIKKFLIILLLTLIFIVSIILVPYFVATYQYEKLITVDTLTKDKVEAVLFLYYSKEIPIEESLWGSATNTKLKKDEYCFQYLILGLEPIDIVYNKDDKVMHTFSSYE